ncbi:alpha/beta fold hydrolase [Actinoalloteichus caeruleus]|uniref:Pimeloyl-ACP methyl ester carboxylesterase n=1 Tax=Actinoalloteichus caeruleus DSM 43889 TaxID=1120930 RepID=A0ABT1JJ61_ACTCY|nr:alpha/beta hydrolase [Actinoalloteichus caeruleus]MCP2332542.1 Pimeloyl-ACP methyl ester carboxylesterase [Actinoalloteichus caeruleus DSM 43889]
MRWESRLVHRAGARLHGRWRAGQGPPLVVVPGVLAEARDFLPVAGAFGRPEPTLVLDRRGRGRSGPLGEDYSTRTEVADLLAWVDELASPVRLVGWSYGATIALEAAALDDRVLGVVAYEPVLAPFAEHVLPALRGADLDTRVEIVNVDIARLPRERVAALRGTPAWARLRELAAPLPEEHAALNRFRPDAAWSGLAADLVLGEHSRGARPTATPSSGSPTCCRCRAPPSSPDTGTSPTPRTPWRWAG